MDTVTRLRHAQQRVMKYQRRLWLAQLLMWPTLVLTAGAAVAGVVWLVRRRQSGGGRHELPETPGAHRADGSADHNGQVTSGASTP